MKKTIIIIAIILLVALFLTRFEMHFGPRDHTRGSMLIDQEMIEDYVKTHHHLPDKLADIPPSEYGITVELKDARGREIQYSYSGSNVRLLSLGRDGQPGGTGREAGVEITFSVPVETPDSGKP